MSHASALNFAYGGGAQQCPYVGDQRYQTSTNFSFLYLGVYLIIDVMYQQE